MTKPTSKGRKQIQRRHAKKEKVPQIGIFFVLKGKSWAEGIPWTESPSIGGFRTYAVGHPEYWSRLQDFGAAPSDMPYEDCPRGRVNYFDATGRFTLLADKCIVKSKPLVRKIMIALGLPNGTTVLRDLHYRCALCMGKVPGRKQVKEDWDF